MSTALVIGSAGQDGYYLTQQLQELGYRVVGVARSEISDTDGGRGLPSPLNTLNTVDTVDIMDRAEVARLITSLAQLERLFFLPAFHHSSEELHEADVGDLLKRSFATHVDAWVNVLDALARHAPRCRSFYAASSHVFGDPTEPVQNEDTPFRPNNVYGITKAAGVEVTRYYRARGQHSSAGILYNHESERRQPKFVSQRIAHGAVRAARAAARGERASLELGSLTATVDWGYAPDYTRAMLHITDHDDPSDYVVASGQAHTVAEFCAAAYGALGLTWSDFVTERPGRITKRLATLVGDAGKLRQLGWRPSTTFEDMVAKLVADASASPDNSHAHTHLHPDV